MIEEASQRVGHGIRSEKSALPFKWIPIVSTRFTPALPQCITSIPGAEFALRIRWSGGDRGVITAQPPTSIWPRRLKGIIAGCLVIRGGCWVGFAGHEGQFQARDLTNFFKFGWARDPVSVGGKSSPFWQVVTNTVFFPLRISPRQGDDSSWSTRGRISMLSMLAWREDRHLSENLFEQSHV